MKTDPGVPNPGCLSSSCFKKGCVLKNESAEIKRNELREDC